MDNSVTVVAKVERGIGLVFCLIVMALVSVPPCHCFGVETEDTAPLCFGSVVFEFPLEDVVMTSSEGIHVSGEHYTLASISRLGNQSFRARIWYGLSSSAPEAPKNIPSTKMDLGSVVASVTCTTDENRQKTCHVSLIPSGTADKPLIFFYDHLSEADSSIADKMWKSAHIDNRCRATPGY